MSTTAKTSQRKIRVLVVDDSALMRKLLTEIINSAADLEVVDSAADPFIARDKIKQLNPDVVTLDVEMPRMDGLTFLRNLMRLRPMPVLMISSLTAEGAAVTLEALESGAIDFITKPQLDLREQMTDMAAQIAAKIRTAAAVPTSKLQLLQARHQAAFERAREHPQAAKPAAVSYATSDKIIAIGSSTGGLDAIREVLEGLPASCPGVVIAQHIPGAFSASFAERMDKLLPLKVQEARDQAQIMNGHVYIAPGGRHLRVVRSGAKYFCAIGDDDPVNRHRPSVDVLFKSVAQAAGRNALGVILTGMGNDGAAGLLAMRETGSHTIAQDEATSVVWGMPGSAVKLGGAVEVLPLERIAPRVLEKLGSS